MKGWLTINETAKRLQLEVDTVRRLEREGKLKASRTPGGHRRFREEEVARYQRARQASRRPKSRRHRATPARPSPRSPTPTQRRAARPPQGGATIVDDPTIGWDEPGDEECPVCEDDDEPTAPTSPPPRQRPVNQQVPAPLLFQPPQPTVPFRRPPPVASQPSEPAGSDPPQTRKPQEREEEARRLQSIKTSGLAAIPYGVSALWRGKVVKDLEQFVTPTQFPAHLAWYDATNIVRARVEEVLSGCRQEVAREEEATKTKVEAERRVAQLIQRGEDYAVQETQDWDYRDMSDALREVEEALRAEVQADWTERDVRGLVDEIADEWVEDGDGEVEEDDDSDDPDADEW